jgi:hypothetical protein
VVIEVVVGNDKVIEAVIDENEEAFSDFDDSEDADYKESSEGEVSDDEEARDSSEVEDDESDDEVCTVAGDDRNTVGDDKIMGGRGSYPEVEDDESSGGSGSMADDDDEEEEIGMIWPRRVRKRKVRPVFEDRRGIGIDSEDDTYEQSSRGFRVRRGIKRQRRMSEFVDSGVVMASSQGDGVVPPSSPPEVGWIIPRGSEDVEERDSEAETVVERAVEDGGEDAESDDPLEPQFGYRYGAVHVRFVTG